MTIEIRRLHAADAKEYRALRRESLEQEPANFEAAVEDEAAMTTEAWAAKLVDDQFFGAFSGQRLVGIARFHAETGAKVRHRGHVTGVYLRPEARGTDIATRLMEAVITAARRQVRFVYLLVNASNQRALRFYTRLGFVVFGHDPGGLLVDGVLHQDILMVLLPEAGTHDGPGMPEAEVPRKGK